MGQVDSRADFITRASGATVFLTKTAAVFVVPEHREDEREDTRAEELLSVERRRGVEEGETRRMRAVWMKVEGASESARVEGVERLPGIVNYFKGNDPSKWRAEIPTYAGVRYAGVYYGVDMVYYGNQRQLEYDFVVRPGASHEQIALTFEGADKLELEAETGDLLLKVGGGTLRQHKPFVYQEVDGERREVESGYELKGGRRVAFTVGAYDHARPLVIDPVLSYSTFLGGSGIDAASDIALDSFGNAYVVGRTSSLNFPTANVLGPTFNGNFDAFVTKLNAAGSALVYSTYLGGGKTEHVGSIAVDYTGNVYVLGDTDSTDFPTIKAFDSALGSNLSDVFITKMNPSGTALVYSTYIGGSGFESAFITTGGIAVDAAGNAYITGSTDSPDFPTVNAFDSTLGGFRDAFVAKLNAAGSALAYSTYLGGGAGERSDGIAVDSSGDAYVTGITASPDFPTVNAFGFPTVNALRGSSDVFVTRINSAGSALVYSIYLGGSGFDQGSDISLDAEGSVYVTGRTDSIDFPAANAFDTTYNGGSFDGFVTKLHYTGAAVIYSAFLGGSGDDDSTGISVDAAGNAYVTGSTRSTDFPMVNAFDSTYGGVEDAFVAKIVRSSTFFYSLDYATYLGGSASEAGSGIAVDSSGDAYVTGHTASPDFPVTPSVSQISKDNGASAFITKLGEDEILFSISGRVIDRDGNPVVGTTVLLSGSESSATTTDGGGYFTIIPPFSGGILTLIPIVTVTPVKAGFVFSPSSITINNVSSNQHLVFVGTPTDPTPTPTPTPSPNPSPSPSPTPATFLFSASSFGVNESAGSAPIIVTRSDDISSVVTVDYATTDATANDRGDYTTVLGTLRFAAGETAKFFSVPVTDDAYAEGNETLRLALIASSPGARVAGPATVTLTIFDNDAVTATTNPIDNTQFFVRQHYVDFLGREPDAAGLSFWVNNIESCGADSVCREAKRIDTSAAFFLSIEFQETGFLVEKIYQAALNRFPAFREFTYGSHEVRRDVAVGQGAWQAQLESNKQTFLALFVRRSDFLALYGGLSNAQYVNALNGNTGGSLAASEQGALLAGLNAGTATRATVLGKVAENAAFTNREFNRAFVLMQYFGYLRRNANDPPDADFSGLNFWLTKLNQFGGDFRRAEMVKSFLLSSEYRQRFGSP